LSSLYNWLLGYVCLKMRGEKEIFVYNLQTKVFLVSKSYTSWSKGSSYLSKTYHHSCGRTYLIFFIVSLVDILDLDQQNNKIFFSLIDSSFNNVTIGKTMFYLSLITHLWKSVYTILGMNIHITICYKSIQIFKYNIH